MIDDFDIQYNPDKIVTCRHCNWLGIIKDTKCNRVVSSPESWYQLCGRDGWTYRCPQCNWIITENYNRIS